MLLLAALSAPTCTPTVALDDEERVGLAIDGPTVELDPAAGVLPFPNLLAMAGTVELPEPCDATSQQKALRASLQQLDGFGVHAPLITLTTSHPVDIASLAGRLRIWRVGGLEGPQDPATAREIPYTATTDVVERSDATCSGSTGVHRLLVIPSEPLEERSLYGVVMAEGVRTTSGERFMPSPTWALLRRPHNPVTVQQGAVVDHDTSLDAREPKNREALLGLDHLWRSTVPVLQFAEAAAGVPRENTLIGWRFPTQTVTQPLDRNRLGTPAHALQPALLGIGSAVSTSASQYLQTALGIDAAACAALGCDAVGDVLTGTLRTTRWQTDGAAPAGEPVPGPWDHPLDPAPIKEVQLDVLAVVPTGAPPSGGWPVVVFGHDLGRSKEDLLVIAPALAEAGLASVAIDWVAHGSRAVRISEGPGCEGSPTPIDAPQCFAPLLSPQLAVTRDNLRQSALDAVALLAALKVCPGNCGGLDPDGSRRGLLGHGVGGFLGAMVLASGEPVEAAVLNAAGGGWIDLLAQTDHAALRCAWVDALIAAGVISGELSDGQALTGTCFTSDWQSQPSWQTFAGTARWLWDAAEPFNFAPAWSGAPVLVQQIAGDAVVPNALTAQLARRAGLGATDVIDAQLATGAAVTPSRNTGPGPGVRWLRYANAPEEGAFPGNLYAHGSLLVLPEDCAGSTECNARQLGAAQMRADAVHLLESNL